MPVYVGTALKNQKPAPAPIVIPCERCKGPGAKLQPDDSIRCDRCSAGVR